MDAFAVSVARGIAMTRFQAAQALSIAFFFGFFQAIMPVAGWFSALHVRTIISSIDHWVAFVLLCIIGTKMIYDAVRHKEQTADRATLKFMTLLGLAIATSIDAFAVGMSISFLQVAIVLPAITIGSVTFVLSFGGVIAGNKLGHFFERKIELLGGILLILIGIKIVLEHLMS
jgi:putative Mn2+ efflux pump MntP